MIMWPTFYLAALVFCGSQAASEVTKAGLCSPPGTLYITGSMQKCKSDADCVDDLKCCATRTDAKVCAPPQPAFTACQHQRAVVLEVARSIDGGSNFLPECSDVDGRFNQVQCDERKGRCWCVDLRNGFEIPGTRSPLGAAINCSNPRICPNPECRMLCPQSFVLDKEGCPVCSCYDACEDIKCPRSTKCITERVNCVDGECPPISKCAARAIDDIDCPNGLPALVDSNKKDYFLCSLLDHIKASKCPSGFQCNVRPNKEFGVCCPIAEENVVKPGQCPVLPARADKACVVECRVDQDCYGDSKCCSDNCTSLCLSPVVPTQCNNQQAAALRVPGAYVPRCDGDGRFSQVQCHNARCWCVDPMAGTELFGTRRSDGRLPDCSAPAQCGKMQCDLQCDHGYKVDADGCPICSCHLPCEELGCPNSCNFVEVDCGEAFCPPIATCREARSLDHPCVHGQPLRNNITKDFLICDRSVSAFSCPTGFQCDPIDAEGHGMCCPVSNTLKPKALIPQPMIPKPLLKTGCALYSEAIAAFGSANQPVLRCDAKGQFETVQCNKQICWCVNSQGHEIAGTRLPIHLNHTINCSAPRLCTGFGCRMQCPAGYIIDADGCPEGLCSCVEPCKGVVCPAGAECLDRQVDCSDDACPVVPRCVAKREEGSEFLRSWVPEPDFPMPAFPMPALPKTNCQLHSEALLAEKSVDVVRCDVRGAYAPVQCGMSTCWCVNASGEEIFGTRVERLMVETIDCKKPKSCGQCRMQLDCPYGLARDSDGCPLCNCNDPCSEKSCPTGGECVVEKVACLQEPCPTIAVCRNAVSPLATSLIGSWNPFRVESSCGVRRAHFERLQKQDATSSPNLPSYRCDVSGQYEPVQCDKKNCWCVDNLGQEVRGTRVLLAKKNTIDCNKPKTCNSLATCKIRCPDGFARDEDGCELCGCAETCEDIVCNQPTFAPTKKAECRFREVTCREQPCPILPFCDIFDLPTGIARQDLSLSLPTEPIIRNPCPFGLPLKDTATNRTVLCGKNEGQAQCPASHKCISLSPNDPAVCCERDTEEICAMPKDTGPCRGAFRKWFFNKQTQTCELFLYGGCEGNANNFADENSCLSSCLVTNRNFPTELQVTNRMLVPEGFVEEEERPLHCPVPTVDESAQCANECRPDSGCSDGKLCCVNGCSRKCVAGEKQSSCEIQKAAYTRMSKYAKAAVKDKIYIPDCSSNGTFERMQCDGKREICWCVNEDGVEVDGTRKPYDPNMSCRNINQGLCDQRMMCRMDCPLGFVKNMTDGCPICECVDPCELYDCPASHECKVSTLTSKDGIEARFPICEPKAPQAAASCPVGLPLRSKESGEFSRCLNDTECPSTHACALASAGQTGICCSKPPSICSLPTETGPCRGMIPRWAFDPIKSACVQFTYGGCQGNGNSFETPAQCEHVCRPTFDLSQNTKIIVVPPEIEAISSTQCPRGSPLQPLVGVSGSNGTVEMCTENAACPLSHNCERNAGSVTCCPKTADDCSLPLMTGQCSQSITRFYFDKTTKTCKQFKYSGCGANGNNFASEGQCKELCPVMTECEAVRQAALLQQRSSSVPVFVPACDEFDGSWMPYQCHPSTGICWCVDNRGRADMATAVRGFPNCPTESSSVVPSNATFDVCDNEFSRLQLCDPTLCDQQVCLGHSRTLCRINPCGGCQVEFVDYDNHRVDCSEGLTECQNDFMATVNSPSWKKLKFPAPLMAPGRRSSPNGARLVAILPERNSSNAEVEKLGFCPPYFSIQTEGCAVECRNDSQCPGEQKCCHAGCGYTCVSPVPLRTSSPSSSEKVLMPIYLPTCSIRGDYEFSQCAGEVCWCIHRNGTIRQETVTKGQIQCNETHIVAGQITPLCGNGIRPQICKDSCRDAKCSTRPDAICVADPCDHCRVRFVDDQGKEVDCQDACMQRVSEGSCTSGQTVQRFHYSEIEHVCKAFNYSGCGGNQNNFVTKEQCVQRCIPKDICMQEPIVGMCRAAFTRWYFDKATGQCQTFTWGGCEESFPTNNFATKEACEARCPQVVSCPRLSASATISTCNRTGLCENAKCAHPLAKCAVDPCECKAVFVDKWNRRLPCDGLPTKCETEAMERSVMADVYHPQCEKNGKYKSTQCFADHFSENCWCVDESGNEIDGERFAAGKKNCQSVQIDGVTMHLQFDRPVIRGTTPSVEVVKKDISAVLDDLLPDSKTVEKMEIMDGKNHIAAVISLRGERAADIVYFFERLLNETSLDSRLIALHKTFERPALNAVQDRSLRLNEGPKVDTPVAAQRTDLLPLLALLGLLVIVAAIVAFVLYRRHRTGSYTNRQSVAQKDVEKSADLPEKSLPNEYASIPPNGKRPVDNLYEDPKF